MKAKVAERGQVTIPKALRRKLGITAGTVLEFRAEDGKLTVTKAPAVDPVGAVYGTLGVGRSSDELVGELRDDA